MERFLPHHHAYGSPTTPGGLSCKAVQEAHAEDGFIWALDLHPKVGTSLFS